MVREIIDSHLTVIIRTLNPLIIPNSNIMDQGVKLIGLNTFMKEFCVLITFNKLYNLIFLSRIFLLAEAILS